MPARTANARPATPKRGPGRPRTAHVPWVKLPSARVHPDDLAKLKARAEAAGVSLATLVRTALGVTPEPPPQAGR